MSGPIVRWSGWHCGAVTGKQTPSEQEFAEKKDEIRESLLEAKQNEMFQLFIANLRKDMEKVNR